MKVPQGADVVVAVQAGFSMVTQVLAEIDEAALADVWVPLSDRQKFLAVGLILGALNGLADFARLNGLDTQSWLSDLALDVTVRASGYPS